MKTAPAWWPSKTTRALIQGKYSRLYGQLENLFGPRMACRIILEIVLAK